ncbi:MAG: hypothetical protein GX057_07835 [Clostridiales bacterium]|nr:hypothetical protein [Clostridiales bacterium]
MKHFFKEYSYYSFKMFLNQFAIALMGLVLALAFGMSENHTGQVLSSVFAVVFYLFLIYYMTWEIGAKDGIRVEHGRKKARPLTGLYMSLIANSPNFVLAVLAAFIKPFGSIAIILQGMYAGILTIKYKTGIVDGELVELPLNDAWWSYFLIILPALLVSMISYILGTKNIGLSRVLVPANPEQEEIKRMKKKGKTK